MSWLGNKALGVVFLGVVVGAVFLTYAVFTQKFTPFDEVTVKADNIGLQLPARADVKIRGKLVGEVREVTANRKGATITLGMYPDTIAAVPADVTAALIPKTLFGEKFVELRVPKGGNISGPHLEAGDVIKQASLPIEIEDVFNTVYPLLRTVPPQDINYTLTALANALEGRGDKLGRSFVTLNNYLTRLDPDLPKIIADLKLLGQTSDVYSSIAPELGQILRNTVITTGTLREKEQQLRSTFDDVARLAGTTRSFLQQNGDNLIELARLGRTQSALLAKYSVIFPCMTQGVVKYARTRGGPAFRDYTLHINLELLRSQPRGYTAAETPRFGDKRSLDSLVPQCYKAINGTWNQNNLPPDSLAPDFNDNVNDSSLGKRAAPQFARLPGQGLDSLLLSPVDGGR